MVFRQSVRGDGREWQDNRYGLWHRDDYGAIGGRGQNSFLQSDDRSECDRRNAQHHLSFSQTERHVTINGHDYACERHEPERDLEVEQQPGRASRQQRQSHRRGQRNRDDHGDHQRRRL